MKSIKEQATLNIVAKDVKSYEIGFEAGANYVLEHLSMTIAVSKDGYLRDNLKIMIEQLKSNQ